MFFMNQSATNMTPRTLHFFLALAAFLFVGLSGAKAQSTTVTPATQVDTYSGNTAYNTLTDIRFEEAGGKAFPDPTGAYTVWFVLPTGFEFNTGATPTHTGSSAAFSGFNTTYLGNSVARISFNFDSTTADGVGDNWRIIGLQVRALNGYFSTTGSMTILTSSFTMTALSTPNIATLQTYADINSGSILFTTAPVGDQADLCFGQAPTFQIQDGFTPTSGGEGAAPFVFRWERSTDLATWTTTGTNSNILTSGQIGSPTQTTYYRRWATKTDAVGGDSAVSEIVTLTVRPLPVVSLSGVNTSYCLNGAIDVLSGNPAGGAYALQIGAGPFNPISSNFNPSTASGGIGTFRYIYTDGFGCQDSADVSGVSIAAPPVAAFTTPATGGVYQSDDATGVKLGGSNPGPGGSFYFFGPGVSNPAVGSPDSARFIPAFAGTTGNVNLSYVATNGAGCSDTATITANIQNSTSGVFISGVNSSYCEDSPVDVITKPSDGTLSIYGPGNVFITSVGTGVTTYNFDPVALEATYGPGMYTFSYFFFQFSPTFLIQSDQDTTFINTKPSLLFFGLNPTHCTSDLLDPLSAFDYDPVTGYTSVISLGTLFTDNPNPSDGISGTSFASSSPGNTLPTVTVFFAYTDANTCSDTVSQTTTLSNNPNPTLAFLSNPDPATFCNNEVGDTLFGAPAGGVIFSPASLSLSYTGSGADSAYVNPSGSAPGARQAVYQYSFGGCIGYDTVDININSAPNALLTTSPTPGITQVCVNAPSLSFVGSPNGAGDSYFGAPATSYLTDLGASGSFNPSAAGVGNNLPVYFVTPNIGGCRDTAVYFVTVNDTLAVDLLFTDVVGDFTDTVICETSDLNTWLVGSPSGGTYSTLMGSVVTVNASNGDFTPNTVGIARFGYSVTSAVGCVNTDSIDVYINPTPVAIFTPDGFCVDDPITLQNSSTLGGGPRSDGFAFSYWQYTGTSTEVPLAGLADGSFTYPSAGSYGIRLRMETLRGCTDAVTNIEQFGEPPVISFDWLGECEGDTTFFTDNSIATDPITDRDWFFGDGGDSLNQTDNLVSYTYPNDGLFIVSETVTTNLGCDATLAQLIAIREVIDTYPYVVDFETGNEGWFEEVVTNSPTSFNSWQRGTPAGDSIVGAASGSNAWMTRLDSSYYDLEISAVRGPCIDLDTANIKRPMIEFYYWSETNEGTDGTVLQASTNDGQTWGNVGNIGTGIEWLDRFGIVGLLPPQVSSSLATGWTGSTGGWVKGRHSLDAYLDQVTLLRFAFGSDGGTGADGFAFDSVVIRERERIILLENFTNSTSSLSFTGDQTFNALVASNASDVLDIQYHTQFPGSDPMNADNPADPSGRSFYYGVNSVPTAVMDGNAFQGASASLTQQQIDLRSLVDVEFDLAIEEYIRTATQLQVTVRVTSRSAQSGRRLNLQIAVLEDTMVFAPALFNGEDTFRAVLKKMIPSASGTIFTNNWTAGSDSAVTYLWNIPASYFDDPSRVRLVAFLQDDDTDEVLQAVTSGTTTGSIITGVEEFEAQLRASPMRVYPNPSIDYSTVDFGIPLPKPGHLDVVNELGVRVAQVPIESGLSEIELPVNQWSSGLYLLRLVVDGQLIDKKSLIVTH